MASLASITSYSSSSSLQSNFQNSSLLHHSKHSQHNHNSSWSTHRLLRSTNKRLAPQTAPRGLKIQSAATKPAKRPGNFSNLESKYKFHKKLDHYSIIGKFILMLTSIIRFSLGFFLFFFWRS